MSHASAHMNPMPLFAPPAMGDRVTLYVNTHGPTVPYVLTAEDNGAGGLHWGSRCILFDHTTQSGLHYGPMTDIRAVGWGHYVPASAGKAGAVTADVKRAGLALGDFSPSVVRGVPVYTTEHGATVADVWRSDMGAAERWHVRAFGYTSSGPSVFYAASAMRERLACLHRRIGSVLAP